MLAEANPLLPHQSTPKRASRFSALLVAAIVSVALVVIVSSSGRPAVLMADGIEPIDKLSFTRAEKAHASGAKSLDDVASRTALSEYYDGLRQTEEEAHAADMAHDRKRVNAKQETLNSYFDTLGAKYKAANQEHMAARKERHPGKLAHTMKRMAKSIFSGEKEVSDAIRQDVKVGEKAAADSAKAAAKVGTEVAAAGAKLAAADKVKVGFYMESMCPGCKYFTTKVLEGLMAKPDFRAMAELEVYPYGNGDLEGNSITCQHGSDECLGNQIIACMQKKYPMTAKDAGFFPAFACMEGKDGKPVDEGQACATEHNLDWAAIQSCATGSEGKGLALQAAQATESLSPAHEYAPWVTLNGKPLRDDAYNLVEKVCDAFVGSKPALCAKKSLKADKVQALTDISRWGFQVCAKESGKV